MAIYFDNSIVNVGGGSGGGNLDTCTVTITQEWGGNDDPALLRLRASYYNALPNGNIEYGNVDFTSNNDLESSHSVTFTAIKHIPVFVRASTIGTTIKFTPTGQGGIIEELFTDITGIGVKYYQLIPTADTAVFTVTSP